MYATFFVGSPSEIVLQYTKFWELYFFEFTHKCICK